MSNEHNVAENVLSEFSVNCQHIDGQTCFAPTNAVQQFVAQCKSGNIIMAHGEVYAPEQDNIPVVTFLRTEILNKIVEFAERSSMSVPEFVGAVIVSSLDDQDTVEKFASIIRGSVPMDGIPAPGETMEEMDSIVSSMNEDDYVPSTESDDPPDPWAFSGSYGNTTDRDPDHDYDGSQKIPKINHEIVEAATEVLNEQRTSTEISTQVLPRLKIALNRIHIKASEPLEIWIGAHREDRIQLSLKYPSDGYDIKESYEGDFDSCIERLSERLEQWENVAFSPKLEEGTSAVAQVGIEILGFDDTQGKYKARVGDAIIYLSPEMVGQVAG